jgi:hypothetical protein
MDRRRREVLELLFAFAAVVPAVAAQDPLGSQGPPQAPDSSRFPDGLPEVTPKVDYSKILKHNQTQIQQDIERLYSLAGELKQQVDKTDSSQVLSLQLLQKADEVEKLAHQIKNLAKG